jgi:hypothetical protein
MRPPFDLQKHILSSYTALRRWIGLLAVALPLILSILGIVLADVALQGSISAYYHAGAGAMRNWFVGILWAIGVFLLLYRGFTQRENIALDLAGILLIVVAMVPMEWGCGDSCQKVSIHGVAAISFFLMIGYVCIFRSCDTLHLVQNPAQRRRYRKLYRLLGQSMWIFPTIVGALLFLGANPLGPYTIFMLETVAIWVFAAYWLIKSRELKESNADLKAAKGALSPAVVTAGARFGGLFQTPPVDYIASRATCIFRDAASGVLSISSKATTN